MPTPVFEWRRTTQPPPEFDCADDKSVLCKLIQIIGDCVSLSYSPKLPSKLVGRAISFTCCLSEVPRGEQEQGRARFIQAIMKKDRRAETIMQNTKGANGSSAKSEPNLTDHIHHDMIIPCDANTLESLNGQHSQLKLRTPNYAPHQTHLVTSGTHWSSRNVCPTRIKPKILRIR